MLFDVDLLKDISGWKKKKMECINTKFKTNAQKVRWAK